MRTPHLCLAVGVDFADLELSRVEYYSLLERMKLQLRGIPPVPYEQGAYLVVSPWLHLGLPFELSKAVDVPGWPNILLEVMREKKGTPKKWIKTIDLLSQTKKPIIGRPEFRMILFNGNDETIRPAALYGPLPHPLHLEKMEQFNKMIKAMPDDWVHLSVIMH